MNLSSVSIETMRALDRISIEKFQIPGIILMENAGMGTFVELTRRPYFQNLSKALILCGKGNNGGDGFVIARHMHNKNIPFTIAYTGDAKAEVKGSDAWVNRRILLNMGITIHEIHAQEDVDALLQDLFDNSLIIDALLGTGLTGEVKEPYSGIIDRINASGKTVAAIDTPSGLNSDTGEILGTCVKAMETFTYGLAKKGFFLAEGPNQTGQVTVVDISIPRELKNRALDDEQDLLR